MSLWVPGNQAGDSVHAYWNPQDFTLLMLQGCLQTGSAPLLDWDLEFTPVDFVSGLIVKLTQNMALGLCKVLNVINAEVGVEHVHRTWENGGGRGRTG